MAVCGSFPNFYQPCVVMIEQNTLALLCEENRAKEQESLCCRVEGFGRTEDRLSKSVRRWWSSLRRSSIWDGTAGSWKTSRLWRWTSKTTGRPPRQVLVHLESEKMRRRRSPAQWLWGWGAKKQPSVIFFCSCFSLRQDAKCLGSRIPFGREMVWRLTTPTWSRRPPATFSLSTSSSPASVPLARCRKDLAILTILTILCHIGQCSYWPYCDIYYQIVTDSICNFLAGQLHTDLEAGILHQGGWSWGLNKFKKIILCAKFCCKLFADQVRQVLIQSCSNLRLGLDLVTKKTELGNKTFIKSLLQLLP